MFQKIKYNVLNYFDFKGKKRLIEKNKELRKSINHHKIKIETLKSKGLQGVLAQKKLSQKDRSIDAMVLKIKELKSLNKPCDACNLKIKNLTIGHKSSYKHMKKKIDNQEIMINNLNQQINGFIKENNNRNGVLTNY